MKFDIVWDGIIKSRTLHPEAVRVRHVLADSAKSGDWTHVIELITNENHLVNTTRPDGSSLYAPLHQAAHNGASVELVRQLVQFGAWRTLQNARGERPLDIAERLGHQHLVEELTPQVVHHVPLGVLLKIQAQFHAVIRGRAHRLIDEHELRLPDLEPLLELERPKMWFAVPGMYGGFSYWLSLRQSAANLVTESWCRVSGGSGQRHEIDATGYKLVEEGFV